MKLDSYYSASIALISGGVGGAKLARGFVKAFPSQQINIIVNTADDTEFYGLHISPDLDTMMYTLAGLSDPKRGWGIGNDSFESLCQLGKYGEATWFKLGDRDLATHILRTKMLREGKTLTQVTSYLSRRLGVRANILPMTDQRVKTFIETDRHVIPFQEYFVLNQKKVHVRRVIFQGIKRAHSTREVVEAIQNADLIVFGPSNPVVSILPILSVPGIRQSIIDSPALKVAVSPFIRKKAVSGPARELMEAKRFEGSSSGVARFYSRLIEILFIHPLDRREKEEVEQMGIVVVITQTLMRDIHDSVQVARRIFEIFLEKRG